MEAEMKTVYVPPEKWREEIRSRIIKWAVENAHEFGYPHVTAENILTDEVYKMYFASILRQSKGNNDGEADRIIDAMLLELGEKP